MSPLGQIYIISSLISRDANFVILDPGDRG
jgi:hypothetical protein